MRIKHSILAFRLVLAFVTIAGIIAFSFTANAQNQNPVYVLKMKGAIGPAIADFMNFGIEKAAENDAELLLIELDTPGGLLTTTREMTQRIINSPVPVVIYVSPSGAHAASAGTFLLYSAHIAAMAPGTNVGAATPIQMQGAVKTQTGESKQQSDNKDSEKDTETENQNAENQNRQFDIDTLRRALDPGRQDLRKKSVEDTAAFIRGLAELRGRNAEWAEKAVTEADSITANEALEKNVIEYVAASRTELLQKINGKTITLKGGQNVLLKTENAPVQVLEPDFVTRFLIMITDPNVAVILMSIGFYGILLEFYNPGTMIPGVIGAISLTMGLYAMNILPVNATGAILMLLGLAFMIAEAFIPSFGILGLGGFTAFVTGMTMLFKTEYMPGLELEWGVIFGVAFTGLIIAGIIVWMAVKTFREKISTGTESMVGDTAKIVSWNGREGKIRIYGEQWHAYSDSEMDLEEKEDVKIVELHGLKVKITNVT